MTAKKRPAALAARGDGGGMPPFIPTDEQRGVVELMAGFGIDQVRIRSVIINPRTGKGISLETLEKAFREELDRGMAKMDALVATSHAQQIKAGNITAIIWYQKNRWGWSDAQRLEHTGKDGKELGFVSGIKVAFIAPNATKPNGHAINGNGKYIDHQPNGASNGHDGT